VPITVFFDQENGTDSFLKLEDLREPKEEFYLQLGIQEYLRTYKEEIEERDREQALEKPYLQTWENNFRDEYVKANESKEFYDLYLHDQRSSEQLEINEWVMVAVESMRKIPQRYIAIDSADDWRIAVLTAYEKIRRERVIDIIFDALKMQLEHKGERWNYPRCFDFELNETFDFRKMSGGRILEERVLNGEPADYNF
jgi:hypothetical protein